MKILRPFFLLVTFLVAARAPAQTFPTAASVTVQADPTTGAVNIRGPVTAGGYIDARNGIGTPTTGHAQFGGSGSYGASIIGYGSAYDFGLFNKNGVDVMHVATGGTAVAFAGNIFVAGSVLNRANNSGLFTGTGDNFGMLWTGTNGEMSTASGSMIFKPAGTTALTLTSTAATFEGTINTKASGWSAPAAGASQLTSTATAGAQLSGKGSTNDITLVNSTGFTVMRNPTGTQNVVFGSGITASTGTFSGYITGAVNSDTIRTGGQIYVSNSEQVALRVGTDNSFNIDTYNGGVNTTAFKIAQTGAATFYGYVDLLGTSSRLSFTDTGAGTSRNWRIATSETAEGDFLIQVSSAANLAPSVTALGFDRSGIAKFPVQLIGKGTATNDNAAPGDIGEYVSSTVLAGSAISLTTDTAANITSLPLTAGDWDVTAVAIFSQGPSTIGQQYIGSISTTTGAVSTNEPYNAQTSALTSTNSRAGNLVLPTVRVSVASTTTLYLVVKSKFTADTMSGYGTIRARRPR